MPWPKPAYGVLNGVFTYPWKFWTFETFGTLKLNYHHPWEILFIPYLTLQNILSLHNLYQWMAPFALPISRFTPSLCISSKSKSWSILIPFKCKSNIFFQVALSSHEVLQTAWITGKFNYSLSVFTLLPKGRKSEFWDPTHFLSCKMKRNKKVRSETTRHAGDKKLLESNCFGI